MTKAGHLTYTITGVEVESSDIDLTSATYDGKVYQMIAMLAGDVNGDGKINNTDVNTIRKSSNFNLSTSSEGVDKLADINGDEKINNTDVNTVRKSEHFNKGNNDCTYSF